MHRSRVSASSLCMTACLLFLLGSVEASAMTISYTLTNISANRYRYDYTVTNDGSLPASAAVNWIYILFASTPIDLQPDGIPDHTIYDNVAIAGSPANWDLILQPPTLSFGGADGVLDALALPGPGVASGSSLGGFSVAFDWWGPGLPGAQPFAIWDLSATTTLPPDCQHTNPTGSDPIACGMTQAAVPMPAGVWLFTSGLAVCGLLRRPRTRPPHFAGPIGL